MKRICNSLIALLLFSAVVPASGSEGIFLLKVRVQTANIRAEPDLNSRIIGRVEMGALLEAHTEADGWYAVSLLASDRKTFQKGYIHHSVIEVVSSPQEKAAPIDETEKPATVVEPEVEAGPPPARRDVRPDENRYLERMLEIEKRARRHSLAFLSLIKTLQPEDTGRRDSKVVEKARMVSLSGTVTETMDPDSRIIYTPQISEEFEVLDKVDTVIKVRLRDGREGWLSERSVQIFTAAVMETQIRFSGVKDSEILRFLEAAENLFARIAQDKLEAEHLTALTGASATQRGPGGTPFEESRLRIEKYYAYAQDFYNRFILDRSALFADTTSLATRISAWTELLLGSQGYTTEYLGAGEEGNSGLTHDISLGADLQFSDKSRLDVNLSNKRDIIQTPYGMSDFGARVNHVLTNGMTLRAGFNLNTYADEADNLNNFARMSFLAGTDFSPSPGTRLGVQYLFLNNAYSESKDNSFSDHGLQAFLNRRTGRGAVMTMRLRGNLESSDSPFRNFMTIEPSIGYEKTGHGRRTSYRADYEKLSFSDLELRSFDRVTLTGSWSRSAGATANNGNLALTYKNFPNNDLMSYIQARGRYSYSRYGPSGVTFSPSFHTNIFTGNQANSFTDLRLDVSGTGRRIVSGLSAYFRFWHSPKAEDGEAKPYVLDLVGRLGLNLGPVRIGPTASVHMLVSSEDKEFFKRDGNLVRFGGFAEGSLALPGRGSLSLDASYEYGFVHTQEISVNPMTGLITIGDLVQRHPTSLQSNALLTFPLTGTLDLIGRFSYYRIQTDMDARLSINPLIGNSRLILLAGVRFRHN